MYVDDIGVDGTQRAGNKNSLNGSATEYGDEAYDEFGEMPDFNFKVILVGNKHVGKTSITNRCVFDEFNEQSSNTRVVQVIPKIFKIKNTQKSVQMHIWDTLGQERFKSLSPLFFRRSVGAFLVYDVTNLESFQAIEQWY